MTTPTPQHDPTARPGSPRLRPLTNASMHRLVLSTLDSLEASAPGRRILDAPCGTGILSMELHARGFAVTCCDLDGGHFAASGLEFVEADLNLRLPFNENPFDLVLSVAGIQRLAYPESAISEFARVLAPGGRLYLGVPNFGSLRMRLRLLLWGSLGPGIDEPEYKQTTEVRAAHFRMAITYPRVANMLAACGFRVLKVVPDIDKPLDLLAFLPISILAWAGSRLRLPGSRKAVFRQASTLSMLAASSYLIQAEKA